MDDEVKLTTEVQVKVEQKLEVKPAEAKPVSAEVKEAPKLEIKQPEAPKRKFNFKLFGRWSAEIQVLDRGLQPYINLTPYYVPYSAGRTIKKQFWKSKKNVVERLMAKLMVTGHKGKKHYWTSGIQPGRLATQYKVVKKTFELIEQRTKKNPLEVFVRALESGAPREGIATIEYGGVRYPKSADIAPQRRLDLVLRWMTQGAFAGSRRHKKHIWETLADEIVATANNDQTKSICLSKRLELERQAAASR